jgi:signal transduction histidine kinase
MKKDTHPSSLHFDRKALSLSRRGAWGQVTIASILITILPVLILAWLWKCHVAGDTLPPVAVWSVCGGGVIVIVLGYTLLFKYPVSIVRLRFYLNTLANGGIPELVTLPEDEDDLAAVQHYLARIVKIAEDRIRMLQAQYEVELEAERQRVMVESIGAMCHHLGQPATVMSMCLYRLKNNPSPGDVPAILAECDTAFNAMTEILDKLRATAHYCSESYLHPSSGQSGAAEMTEERIIKG